ncbi:retrotransposon protein, putative, ty1-copia subclass [Tanacetum coccineum]|uniref:Retrotransposon protein, putative, ty1-copia subclass n=1 Tax=Tanacetum coccineum TaxID=301880 RepID=A0ABQ5F3K4_9ASTR
MAPATTARRHVSRQGASYFITFTDDYSRYGYVYLLKHKHEVFEMFKVFKNEVENQLGKTIKALRSDRGGEYISQEFKDYLKACGIVQQLTPPYTPQHNEVWGCEALVKWDTPDKLQQRSVKCIFIGYPKKTMGYYFYFPLENKIVVARYADFFEKNLITQEVSGRAMDLEEIQDEDTSPFEITSKIPMEVEVCEPPQKEVILVCRSERTHRAPDRLCLNIEAGEHSLGDHNEPTSYKVAMLDSEFNKWIDAMNAEIQSMMDNIVWVLVDLPPDYKTVGSKWIFKKKTDMDGIVHTYKARLVAKGYTQLYGVDYEETFSPVADIRAIRILISIAAFYDYEIWQIDVKTAFLNGLFLCTLDEDIYMVQPEASRSWNKRFDEEIKRFGFDQNLNEPCVYQKASGSNVTFLILDRSKRLIGLGQNAYMDKILKRYKMDNSKHGHIPMQEDFDIEQKTRCETPKEVKRMQNVPYASVVGSIMYAVRCTRPDVAFANTKDMFLVYGGNPEAELRVDCYCDAGFENDKDDIKCQTGYVFILNGGPTIKTTILNLSTTHASRMWTGRSSKQKIQHKGKTNGKGKDKHGYISKPKNPKPTAKEHPAKDDTCHHCKEVGHWKRNCPVYLAELLKKKKQVGTASSSGIFTIELFAFPNKSWVYDTGCGTHVCITKQGFREARKLKQGALYLYVGNGVRAQVEAIGSFDLVLPNGLCFTDFGISVSKNNVHYFNAIPSNGIYEIDMHDLVPNNNSIYNVSTKRAKHNLDSTYLWHCRLAHISKKRIEKLQQEGLLRSTDHESFDQCVSCLSGKMTRKSFPHRPERATDLLGIIHTDVCGPLRHVSRQGVSYFITFTDDYSRYGYVYLLKHIHEVLETFKVFKNEVENQLEKTIKALRSDRGGEYISQEFKDYLKNCGIVQQLTPPYTPQHNESTKRILNMVPTKKVDKTPYELWYGKVPNLSYLKVNQGKTMGYYFYFPPENKIVVARYAEFFEKNLITQEVSGRAEGLEEIQDEDTSPSEITSKIPMEVEGFKPPQEEVIPIRRSERTHRAPERLCLNVEVEEHSLGDLNEPTSYKAAMLDPEFDKWIDAMNAEMQSMIDNMVWVLVDLPPNCKTVGSKWLFKIKTDMDGNVHTYKARLVAKGYTQLYGVDYKETFSPVADIRAIRIFISIAAFYDYEI